MTVTVDKVISKFMALREQKEAIEREMKERLASIREDMGKLETWILAKMEQEGVSQFKTDHGTAFKATTDHAGVADWQELIEFIKANDAYDLLEKRVSKQAVRSYLDIGQPPPPGVNYTTRVDVAIRKPTGK